MSQRQERFSRLIQAELAGLMRNVKDPRVADAGFVTITQCAVTNDLSLARVGVVLHGGDAQKEKALLEGLTRAAPYLRAELRKLLAAKTTPELRFTLDRSVDASDRVGAILQSIKDEHPPAPVTPAPADEEPE